MTGAVDDNVIPRIILPRTGIVMERGTTDKVLEYVSGNEVDASYWEWVMSIRY
jgi:hypothetical protein